MTPSRVLWPYPPDWHCPVHDSAGRVCARIAGHRAATHLLVWADPDRGVDPHPRRVTDLHVGPDHIVREARDGAP